MKLMKLLESLDECKEHYLYIITFTLGSQLKMLQNIEKCPTCLFFSLGKPTGISYKMLKLLGPA